MNVIKELVCNALISASVTTDNVSKCKQDYYVHSMNFKFQNGQTTKTRIEL